MKLTSENKMFLGIIGVTIAIIVIAVTVFSKPPVETQTLKRSDLIESNTIVKNASASAFLVEFSDFQCPACKAAKPVVDDVLKTYGDKITFAYRHFPLDQHPYSVQAGIAAEAANRQGKFWEMGDAMFASVQEQFSDSMMLDLAKLIKLDVDQFKKDIADPALKDKVLSDRAAGIRLDVNATPTFYLNGKKLDLASYSELKSLVAAAVK